MPIEIVYKPALASGCNMLHYSRLSYVRIIIPDSLIPKYFEMK